MGGPRVGADTPSPATSTPSAGWAERSSLPGHRCLAAVVAFLSAGATLFTVYLRLSETCTPNHWEPRVLVRKYFGRPVGILHTGPYTVLVWDRNLLLSIPR